MFILRTILTDTRESNAILGHNYKLTQKGDGKFDELLSSYTLVNDKYKDDVFAIITTSEGNEHIPLFGVDRYFIMTESGKTFARLN